MAKAEDMGELRKPSKAGAKTRRTERSYCEKIAKGRPNRANTY